MNNEELLNAVSEMMDEKLMAFGKQMDERFDRINKRLDFMALKQNRMGNKLTDISLDVEMAERDSRSDIRHMNDTLEILTERLQTHSLITQ